jgi:hypothetical protein
VSFSCRSLILVPLNTSRINRRLLIQGNGDREGDREKGEIETIEENLRYRYKGMFANEWCN